MAKVQSSLFLTFFIVRALSHTRHRRAGRGGAPAGRARARARRAQHRVSLSRPAIQAQRPAPTPRLKRTDYYASIVHLQLTLRMQPILMERLGEMSSRATATGEPLCRGGVADGCAKEPRETLPNRRDRRAGAPFSTCTVRHKTLCGAAIDAGGVSIDAHGSPAVQESRWMSGPRSSSSHRATSALWCHSSSPV